MYLPARLNYAGVVAPVTFITLLLTAGVRAAPGVLIVPLENEFHWARSAMPFAVGANLLLCGLIGPCAAALIDRFGVRRTMAVALAVTAAAVALTPAMRRSWQLVLLWGVVVGASCGVIGNFLAAFIAARWFRVRQGRVVGVLTAANAAGQLIFLPTMASQATSAGWRLMSLLLPASVAAFVPLIALFMRDRPEDLGLASLRRRPRLQTRAGARRQRVDSRLSRAWRRRPLAQFLADFRQLFCLPGLDERADRHASDPGLRRPWSGRGHRGGPSRGDWCLPARDAVPAV